MLGDNELSSLCGVHMAISASPKNKGISLVTVSAHAN